MSHFCQRNMQNLLLTETDTPLFPERSLRRRLVSFFNLGNMSAELCLNAGSTPWLPSLWVLSGVSSASWNPFHSPGEIFVVVVVVVLVFLFGCALGKDKVPELHYGDIGVLNIITRVGAL